MATSDTTDELTGGRVDVARSWLFVPGDRADRFDKAVASGADVAICDLEDAVAPDAKESARADVASWLGEGRSVCVRVNAPGTAWSEDDVAALRGRPGLLAVVVPKAEDPAALTSIADALGVPVVALVESALGVHRAHDVAAARGVSRLAFGSIDYALDIGCSEDDRALLHARSVLVLASRVAGLPAPVDGVTTDLDDEAAAGSDALAALRLGFGGKLCIHPRQVAAVNAAMAPSAAEVARAARVVDAARSPQAVRVDGQMVDKPVVERAREVLRRARLFAVPGTDDSRDHPDDGRDDDTGAGPRVAGTP